jgi:anthranilate phosphoribosyltransferase
MKSLLNRLTQHEHLDRDEARETLVKIAKGEVNHAQIASFLTVYMMRSITVAELEGFREALLSLCIPIDLKKYNAIDLCGTGGDGKDTFNISTLAAFVTAGAGVKVTKHGNYGVSSGCGSSNVLEALGIRFTNEEKKLQHQIEEAGICILHAPLFHPAMKEVAPVRKDLGVKTFFNMLGPLVNPSFPKKQVSGVFTLELARLYHYVFQNTDSQYTVLYALDGYDEISLTGPTKTFSHFGEQLLHSSDFGLTNLTSDSIVGGHDIASSAAIFSAVLDGKGTLAQQQVVCANAGIAIATALNLKPKDGYDRAYQSLVSGKAKQAFITLQKVSAL